MCRIKIKNTTLNVLVRCGAPQKIASVKPFCFGFNLLLLCRDSLFSQHNPLRSPSGRDDVTQKRLGIRLGLFVQKHEGEPEPARRFQPQPTPDVHGTLSLFISLKTHRGASEGSYPTQKKKPQTVPFLTNHRVLYKQSVLFEKIL